LIKRLTFFCIIYTLNIIYTERTILLRETLAENGQPCKLEIGLF